MRLLVYPYEPQMHNIYPLREVPRAEEVDEHLEVMRERVDLVRALAAVEGISADFAKCEVEGGDLGTGAGVEGCKGSTEVRERTMEDIIGVVSANLYASAANDERRRKREKEGENVLQ